jgi:hypothetical protein
MIITKHHNNQTNWVLIMSGLHGNEIAGKIAIKKLKDSLPKNFNYCIIEEINETDLRLLDGVDLNREFFCDCKNENITEAIKEIKGIGKFKIVIDLHETFDKSESIAREGLTPNGFYLYEKRTEGISLGHEIIAKLENIGISICQHKTIWGEKNTYGVILYPEDNTNKTYQESYTFENFVHNENLTTHSIVLESYGGNLLTDRVRAHQSAIRTILKALE